jgi:hypothetical protein
MTIPTRDAFIAAAKWLKENPRNHTQGSLAINRDGKRVRPNDPEAKCFCFLGRAAKEMGLANYPDWERMHEVGLERIELIRLNDGPRRLNLTALARGATLATDVVCDYVLEKLCDA